MRFLKTSISAVAMLAAAAMPAAAQDAPLDIVFTHHSSASNTFWQAVQRGFEDACQRVDANCQMILYPNGRVDRTAGRQHAGCPGPLAGRADHLDRRQRRLQ